ncbi:MAG TPA: hypothetical protein VMC07_02805 [Candidatus Omnitrophota bacterium]|nr:hypothetical protein [Candidatus Omnitrophota bacterium]
MAAKIKEVLKEALIESKPSEKEIKEVESYAGIFLEKLRKEIRILKINAEVFIGGSFAKKTLIKKDKYDVDIFLRFGKGYKDISETTHKILKKMRVRNMDVIHGSRDYFRINAEPWFCLEVVPTREVSKPKDAENITDLSYYHVKYINRKIKEKIVNDIILAKSFCHANRIYGAESHIKGFSGYSLELLVYYYKSFENFIRTMAKLGDEKIIIDIEKFYQNKRQVMMDLNSSKLNSPIILVDPTYKQRNALATLSYEVFRKFREKCREFLKNPDIKFFRLEEIDLKKIEIASKKKGYDSALLKISTDKQEGAVAGSKLLKFYEHLAREIGKYFDIKDKIFYYQDRKDADCFFAAKKRDKILLKGPPEKMNAEFMNFKKKHKRTFVKSGIIYAEEKTNFSLKEFVTGWKNKNKKITEDMSISEIKVE